VSPPVTHSHFHGHRPYGRSRKGFAHDHEHTHPDGVTNHQLSGHEHYRDDPDGEIVRPGMSDPGGKTGS
jgi:hypothetical protein